MSGKGVDFLADWLHRNLTDADRKGSRERAKELAAACVAQAATSGIMIDDMEPEWGSVETIIYEAMQNDMDVELEFWKEYAKCRSSYPS